MKFPTIINPSKHIEKTDFFKSKTLQIAYNFDLTKILTQIWRLSLFEQHRNLCETLFSPHDKNLGKKRSKFEGIKTHKTSHSDLILVNFTIFAKSYLETDKPQKAIIWWCGSTIVGYQTPK